MAKRASPGMRTKAEIITFRAPSKFKYGLELMARKQHRNTSQVIEWAIAKLMDDEAEGLVEIQKDGRRTNILNEIWNPDEITRFINLATKYKGLLTDEEEVIWQEINRRTNEFFTTATNGDLYDGGVADLVPNVEAIRAHWNELLQFAAEK